MKTKVLFLLILSIVITSCKEQKKKHSEADLQLAEKVKLEFVRSWNAYKSYNEDKPRYFYKNNDR